MSAGLLAALQLGDSFFPSGGFTLSHGLETLVADGLVVDAGTLAAGLAVSLEERLAKAELPALLAAHRACHAPDLRLVIDVDHLLMATRLAREEREASARVGRRLATEVARLRPDHGLLREYLNLVLQERVPGGAPVALGLAGAALDVPEMDTGLVLCHSFATAWVSAGMRLLRLGHGAAQRVLATSHSAMERAVEVAGATSWRDLGASMPQLEIAAMRHERADVRYFAS